MIFYMSTRCSKRSWDFGEASISLGRSTVGCSLLQTKEKEMSEEIGKVFFCLIYLHLIRKLENNNVFFKIL